MEPLGWSEKLFGVQLLIRSQRIPRGVVEGRGNGLPLARALRPRENQGSAGTGHRQVREPCPWGHFRAFDPPVGRLGEQARRHPVGVEDPGTDRPAVEAEEVDVLELQALDLLGVGEDHRARRRSGGVVGIELARVRDRGQMADEVAHRSAWLAARPRGGQLGEA